MSAYLEHKSHIDALVQAALDVHKRHHFPLGWFHPSPDQATSLQEIADLRHEISPLSDADAINRVGQMLWDENARSVSTRYAEDVSPGQYTFRRPKRTFTQVDILKAVDGYEYQSCEHHEWKASEAYAFCAALRRAYICLLPGYGESDAWCVGGE